jgi:hypothetical protein
LLSVGCAVDPSPSSPSEPAETAPSGAAYLEVQFTDTSVAVPDGANAQLWVMIGRLQIQHASGAWTTISSNLMRFDLFAVEHGDISVVASGKLVPDDYSALAIDVEAAELVVDGATTPVTIANGSIDVALSSSLGEADSRALVLDFDASKSLQTATGPSAPAKTSGPPSSTPPNIVLTPAITVASFGEM